MQRKTKEGMNISIAIKWQGMWSLLPSIDTTTLITTIRSVRCNYDTAECSGHSVACVFIPTRNDDKNWGYGRIDDCRGGNGSL
jgi:hypothetical protein